MLGQVFSVIGRDCSRDETFELFGRPAIFKMMGKTGWQRADPFGVDGQVEGLSELMAESL